MVATHYRWDFIGLSTDDKPTSETSEKVVNGSTFYCSDTSKLYVYCDGTWYERKPLGSGGGGTTYTAGNGIDITSDVISVDTTTIQEKLTAGEGITIAGNIISAIGGSGGDFKTLTTADNNWNKNTSTTEDPNSIALWLLPDGIYSYDTSKVDPRYTTGSSSSSGVSSTGAVIVSTGGTHREMLFFEGNNLYFVSTLTETGISDSTRRQIIKENNVKNNLTTTAAGSVLDARQGKELKALIDALDQRVTALGG